MLELKNVSKQYEGNKGIRNIDLQFHEGEITGILGRNGSGKTTLLKAILNLLQIDTGEILLNNQPVSEQMNVIAFISEEGSFMPNMSVKEYGKFLKGYYPAFDLMNYHKVLQMFDIDGRGKIKNYSKGQKMKIEIAAGCSMNAKLIILDEPFNGLDVYAKEDTIQLLIQQLHEDTIILLSTHNIEEIEHVVDRCILLDDGIIKKDESMEDIHERGMDLKDLMEQYK